jgi:hypothetical protein
MHMLFDAKKHRFVITVSGRPFWASFASLFFLLQRGHTREQAVLLGSL